MVALTRSKIAREPDRGEAKMNPSLPHRRGQQQKGGHGYSGLYRYDRAVFSAIHPEVYGKSSKQNMVDVCGSSPALT